LAAVSVVGILAAALAVLAEAELAVEVPTEAGSFSAGF
jgi:hypothetical protein